ncbi:VWA domain-containing protein [Corynebacterium urealyticum]|uniref:VWA domain-containing protein n=1 Tax=Corynebacterium urealyticum TaxID=43771 RepID=UPI0002B3F5FC|nr:VWA domain-containing protein [Corynebacterium urealyticum]AGE37409.1 surface-anchored protein (fimbrial subunit) [Corynebacterium urealyticum DSM 7111]QQB07240.1 VWA domain-containing protein [Corynebacterium urealyticum]
MKTKFMGVAAALTAALALVFGVAVPGALPSLPAPTAQAKDRSFTIAKQQKYTQKGDRHIPNYKIPADQLSGGTLTLGAGTVVTLESRTTFYSAPNPADFTVYYTGTGGYWHETKATYKKISDKKFEVTLPEMTIGGAAEIEFKGVHRGPAGTVISATFDVVGGTTQPEPREWAGSDSHGQYTMRATQGQEPTVTFTRKLGEDGTLSGAIEAWVADKNGYDVDGRKDSRLRITGPDGSVIYETSGWPGSDNVTPIQNWAGVKFPLPQNLEVDAGTTIEIVSPYGVRQGNPVTDSSIQSPIGPGTFKINFEKASNFQYPNQTQFVCNPLTASGDVHGFRIFPRSDAKRQIREVRAVGFLDPATGQLTRINEPFDVVLSPSGVNDTADVRFANAVPNPGNRPVCALVNFDADREIKPKSPGDQSGNQPADHFTLAARRDVYPEDGNEVYQNSQIKAPSDWDRPQVANPDLAPRCGQNIAIVLDASNSVIAKNGVDAEADAARRIVEALSGTATSVGIYNFASQGTRFNDAKVASTPLADPEGKNRVLQAIENYRRHMKDPATLQSRGQGATNWEGALKEIEAYNSKNQNKKYDVVYFVTDGFPTFSDSEKPGGGDDGSAGIVHVSDVIQARVAADNVKKQGTRIQPVLVNIPKDFKEPIAKDSTADFKNLDRYREMYKKSPAHTIMVWGSADPNASFVRDQLNSQTMDVFGLREDTLWGQGLGDVLASNTEPAAKQPLPDNRRKVLGDRDWKTWAVGERTATEMGDIISGAGTSVLAESFGDLDRVLSELALASCAGTVSLQKSVVTPDGKAPDEPKLDGWEFTAQTKGNNLLDPDGKRVNQTTGKTDDRGSLTFNLETDAPDQKPKVRISEKQQAGHSLLRQKQSDGSEAYAVCTAHSNKGGQAKQVIVRTPADSADSFELEVDADSIVNCSVVNQMDPEKGYFRVEKVNENGDPLDGSSFEVWRADSTGTKPTGDKPVWRTGDESKVRMEQGDYVLIETEAPGGYSLLPQPIAFRIGLDGVKQTIELTGKQGASFVLEYGQDKKPERTGTFMKVANVTVGELPKTGGYGVGLVGLIGAALAGAGLLLGRRKTA